jgi:hypothetical protein
MKNEESVPPLGVAGRRPTDASRSAYAVAAYNHGDEHHDTRPVRPGGAAGRPCCSARLRDLPGVVDGRGPRCPHRRAGEHLEQPRLRQPSFTPDGASVLFTSSRGGGATQTDIYRYDIARRQVVRVTETPESEYSPTITPDGAHISVIRVEADKTQRLWQFSLDGRQPTVVLAGVKPVGYHVWIDDHTLGLFVLGSPATLHVADTRTGKSEEVARDVGRSLQRMPGGRTISFVVRDGGAGNAGPPTLSIREYDPRTRTTAPVVWAVPGARWRMAARSTAGAAGTRTGGEWPTCRRSASPASPASPSARRATGLRSSRRHGEDSGDAPPRPEGVRGAGPAGTPVGMGLSCLPAPDYAGSRLRRPAAGVGPFDSLGASHRRLIHTRRSV